MRARQASLRRSVPAPSKDGVRDVRDRLTAAALMILARRLGGGARLPLDVHTGPGWIRDRCTLLGQPLEV